MAERVLPEIVLDRRGPGGKGSDRYTHIDGTPWGAPAKWPEAPVDPRRVPVPVPARRETPPARRISIPFPPSPSGPTPRRN